MHAWRGHAPGPPESLRWEDIADPPLAEGQARIEVRAAAVNFPDILYTAGTYQVKPVPPFSPGFEIAGVVTESRTGALLKGARVAATLPNCGGYATEVVVSPDTAYLLPDPMGFEDGAAMTLTYQTAWFALHRRAHLQPGEWLLVHAGAGGVGSAAIQLGVAAGARVLATAGGPEKVALCKELGAEVAIDYSRDDFAAVVKDLTRGHGADVVFDPVGGEVFERSTRCIAFEGRIVVIGFTSGRFPEARVNHVLVKNYGVLGLHWGTYNRGRHPLVRECQRALYGLHAEGRIRPLISERVPLREAPAAMNRVATRASTGKIVLIP